MTTLLVAHPPRPSVQTDCDGRTLSFESSTTTEAEMHWLLFYDYVPDYLARRGEVRQAHMAHAAPYLERGELVLGGAYANPADGAAILFFADGPETAQDFARNDPYVRSGLVTGWRVREWTTVIGPDAARPLTGPE